MLPLKAFVSTVESTTGTPNTRAAFASTRLLLMIDWRSWLATPKSICGCRSMIATTQLSGVSNPFSLRLDWPEFLDMTFSSRKLTRQNPVPHSLKKIHERSDGLLRALFQNPVPGVFQDDDRDIGGDQFRLCCKRGAVRLG